MNKFDRLSNDFKSAFQLNDYISNYSIGRALGEFFKIAMTPFILISLMGLVAVFSNDRWDSIFEQAISEFVQLTGLKLSLYLVIILHGFGFIFYRFLILNKFIVFIINSLSKFGFVVNSALFGAYSGMIVVNILNQNNSGLSLLTLNVYIVIVFLFLIFYFSAKIFSSNVRHEINYTFEKHTYILTFVFGLILLVMGTIFIYTEPWSELNRFIC